MSKSRVVSRSVARLDRVLPSEGRGIGTAGSGIMEPNKTAVERAFELARSERCRTLTHIRLRLRAEGYDPDQIEGPVLQAQLNALLQSRK